MRTPRRAPSPSRSRIISDLWWRAMVMSVIPDWRRRSIMISTSGRPPTRTRGLGVDSVSGRSRRPSPPAMITAGVGRGGAAICSSRKSTSTSRRPVSTRGRWRMARASISSTAAARPRPGEAVTGAGFMMSATTPSSGTPRRMARRRSPSVTIPARTPSASATRTACRPFLVIASSASRSEARGLITILGFTEAAPPCGGP